MTKDGPHHGGDLSRASGEFGSPASGWLDLSTGINPNAYPDTQSSHAALTHLPQHASMAALLKSARGAYEIADDLELVAGPGSQSILQILPSLRPKSDVVVLSPTYEEHVGTWQQFGHNVREIEDRSQVGAADVVVLVNPNNPDGTVAAISNLRALDADLANRGSWLVVDEAFADVTPQSSMAAQLGLRSTIIVRSFGKFFGLPGLRLGFAIGPPDIVTNISTRLGPWAVSGPAIEVGTRALNDTIWIDGMRRKLADLRRRLDAVLAAANLGVVGGTDLFCLVETAEADQLYRHLGRAGILVRPFERQPKWLRFGLPSSPEELHRLEMALADFAP